MKIIEKLKNTQKTLFSFEIVPPLKGHNLDNLHQKIELLTDFNPLNINITYHQDETIYTPIDNNVVTKKIVRKRPGTVALAAAIKNRYPEVETVPHLICGGMTKEAIENILIDLNFLGIENILLLRGDAPRGQRYFIPESGGYAHTLDLVKQIANLNNGIYLDKDLKNTDKTNFSTGVAGYPEKHIESPNMQTDLKYLKEKIVAGAEYIVTQMFFDNQKFYEFEKQCRQIGITVPIIPAIKPIAKQKDIDTIPQVFNIDLPMELMDEVNKAKNDNDLYNIGIEWTIAQSKDLMAHGVPCIHYFSVGKTDNIREVAKAVF